MCLNKIRITILIVEPTCLNFFIHKIMSNYIFLPLFLLILNFTHFSDLIFFSFFNMISFMASTLAIVLLQPRTNGMWYLLDSPPLFLELSFFMAMMVISPTALNLYVVIFIFLVCMVLFYSCFAFRSNQRIFIMYGALLFLDAFLARYFEVAECKNKSKSYLYGNITQLLLQQCYTCLPHYSSSILFFLIAGHLFEHVSRVQDLKSCLVSMFHCNMQCSLTSSSHIFNGIWTSLEELMQKLSFIFLTCQMQRSEAFPPFDSDEIFVHFYKAKDHFVMVAWQGLVFLFIFELKVFTG